MCGYWEQYGGCMRIVGTQWGTFGKIWIIIKEHMWGACKQGTQLGTLAGGGRGVVAKKNLQVCLVQEIPHSSPSPKGGEFLTIH